MATVAPRYSVTRRIQFCCGHRVVNHESKCRNMHGHNYILWVHAKPKGGTELDELGRVIDFSVIKDKVKGWIDEHWDHGFVYKEIDSDVLHALSAVENQKKYPMFENPTAENMANHLLKRICPGLFKDTGVEVYGIKLEETENCYAEVWL